MCTYIFVYEYIVLCLPIIIEKTTIWLALVSNVSKNVLQNLIIKNNINLIRVC